MKLGLLVLFIATIFYMISGYFSNNEQVNQLNENIITVKPQSILPISKVKNSKDARGNDWKQSYETKEYYLYDMFNKCRTIISNNLKTINQLENFLTTNFPQDTGSAFDISLTHELKSIFNDCKNFMEKNIQDVDLHNQNNLLKNAVLKKDASAMARKSYNDVFMEKKEVLSVQNILIESLTTNNPEALFTLSMFVKQLSNKKNNSLISAALLYRACGAGYSYCGYNSLQVQQLCQEQSVCGSTLQESLLMSVPSHLANEFEKLLVEISYIKTENDWHVFFENTLIE